MMKTKPNHPWFHLNFPTPSDDGTVWIDFAMSVEPEDEYTRTSPMVDDVVCDAVFDEGGPCDSVGTVEKTVAELRILDREHSDYWSAVTKVYRDGSPGKRPSDEQVARQRIEVA